MADGVDEMLTGLHGPVAQRMAHQLLGCAWGRELATPDDQEECPERAAQIVVLHAGEAERAFKLCDRHREKVYAMTDPHQEQEVPE